MVESRPEPASKDRQAPVEGASAEVHAPEAQASGPVRTCVGCMKKVDARDPNELLVKVVRGPAIAGAPAEIAIDASPGATAGGRGAHVHATRACVKAAAERGLERSFKSAIALGGERVTPASLSGAIIAAEERKLSGMIVAAARAKRAVAGAEQVRSALRSEGVRLVLVATDAQAAAELTEVRRAIADGKAVAWGTKAALADLVRGKAPRESASRGASGEEVAGAGVGVIAILDRQLASGIARSVMAIDGVRGTFQDGDSGGNARPGRDETRGRGQRRQKGRRHDGGSGRGGVSA